MTDRKSEWVAAEREAAVAYEAAERALEAWDQARADWKVKTAEARRCWQAYRESEKGKTP